MANPTVLAPVSEDDPCGPDLRWDPEFMALADTFATVVSSLDAEVVEGQTAATDAPAFDEVIDAATDLCGKTKDIRLLAILAEASWHHAGLAAFADAMEDMVGAVEAWPGGADGVHPRADESDGDLSERAAALGRLVNRIPVLAATVGWGRRGPEPENLACAERLHDIFEAWKERLGPAFGDDLPIAADAWNALRELVGPLAAGPEPAAEEDGETPRFAPAATVDAWDLIDQAFKRMIEQDHHSPALPLLRLLSTWRTLEIIDILERMKASGVTLEQLMESVKRQTQVE